MTTLIRPDRAKCDNRACPSSEECLRYRAPAAPLRLQRWCMFRPKDGEIACDAFIRYEDDMHA